MVYRVYVDTVDIDNKDPEEWMERASCVNQDPQLFFPEKRRSTLPAKKICWEKCPVRLECLAKALYDERVGDRRWGVFGGLTPTERKELQAKLDKLAQPPRKETA